MILCSLNTWQKNGSLLNLHKAQTTTTTITIIRTNQQKELKSEKKFLPSLVDADTNRLIWGQRSVRLKKLQKAFISCKNCRKCTLSYQPRVLMLTMESSSGRTSQETPRNEPPAAAPAETRENEPNTKSYKNRTESGGRAAGPCGPAGCSGLTMGAFLTSHLNLRLHPRIIIIIKTVPLLNT